MKDRLFKEKKRVKEYINITIIMYIMENGKEIKKKVMEITNMRIKGKNILENFRMG